MRKAREVSMTEGPLLPAVVRFSVPLMASNVLQVLFNMSDIAVVGRFAGPEALGAVGSTSILVSLFTGFVIGMGSGVNVTVARFLGAGKWRDASESVHTSCLVLLVTGLLLFLLGFAFTPAILCLLGTKDVLLQGAIRYLRMYLIGMPALALFNFGNGVLSAAGDTRHPLIFLTLAGVLNVLLNILFVVPLHMAEMGVGLASALSQCVSAALMLVFLVRRDDAVAIRRERLRISPEKCRQILALSVPSGLQNAIFALANLFIQAGVNTFDAVVVEGSAAAANADPLVYDVMAAVYTACSSFMSRNYGAGNRARVRKSYLICLGLSFGIAAVLSAFLVIFGRAFLGLFTHDSAVVQAGMERLRVMGFSYAFSAFMDCTIAASRGLGRSLWPTVIVMLGSCVFRVIWVYTVFAHFHTIRALYLLYIFSWTITGVAEIVYFLHCYAQRMRRIGERGQNTENEGGSRE
ncbi:MAG: MATE family efflux transporter [Clostridia bacterium]|nr:MATE family efflux transporter [Clostridia bacterium]